MSAPVLSLEQKGSAFPPLVGVGAGWFSTAFEVAVGNTISEALERFSDELRAVLDANGSDERKLSADSCLALVRRVQQRMTVAAEWAERLERLDDERSKRDDAPASTASDAKEMREHLAECLANAKDHVEEMGLAEQENWRKEAFPKALAELRAAKVALESLESAGAQ